jgi:pSer/pThr/pTyr-binding forkhead associated (FHA) protein
MPRFTVLRDGRLERSLALMLDEVSIGRMPGAHVELPQPSVSRRHARIRREGDAWILEDLGSMNGVMLGDRRVRRAVLVAGDRIRIENYDLVFEPAEDLYQAGLRQAATREASATGPHSFSMTYVSAGAFTASTGDRSRK